MKNLTKAIGIVVETLPNGQFIVDLEGYGKVRCYLSGKMNKNHIRIILADKVEVELTTTIKLENQIGRIIFRKNY
jgi:translation initiation factor IF-1